MPMWSYKDNTNPNWSTFKANTSDLKELLLTLRNGLTTDGSSDKGDKL